MYVRFNNPTAKYDWPTHLIRNMLRLGYCAALLGKCESGKSDLATAIALAVAEGTTFAGNLTTQGSVLWLSAEDPFDHHSRLLPVLERLKDLPFHVSYDRPAIHTEEGIADIREVILKARARLVVVDGLPAFHRCRSAREALAPFSRLCYKTGVTGLIVQSVITRAKPEIEASHFAEAADMAIYLDFRANRKGRAVTLRSTGRGADSCWQIELISPEPFAYHLVSSHNDPGFTSRFTLDDQVLSLIAGSRVGISAPQISTQLDRNPNSIRNVIARLKAAGKIHFSHTAGRCKHYQIHKGVLER